MGPLCWFLFKSPILCQISIFFFKQISDSEHRKNKCVAFRFAPRRSFFPSICVKILYQKYVIIFLKISIFEKPHKICICSKMCQIKLEVFESRSRTNKKNMHLHIFTSLSYQRPRPFVIIDYWLTYSIRSLRSIFCFYVKSSFSEQSTVRVSPLLFHKKIY